MNTISKMLHAISNFFGAPKRAPRRRPAAKAAVLAPAPAPPPRRPAALATAKTAITKFFGLSLSALSLDELLSLRNEGLKERNSALWAEPTNLDLAEALCLGLGMINAEVARRHAGVPARNAATLNAASADAAAAELERALGALGLTTTS